jgi:type IV pilus assembly protein PilE
MESAMKMQKGFTLIELMIVMAVIGILAAVAFPSYQDYVRRGQITQATSTLSDARIKFEQWYQDHRTYVGAESKTMYCPADTALFAFVCVTTGAPTDTYSITATGVAGTNMDGFSYSIDQTNTKNTVASPWGAGACWITKKGGGC